MSENWNDVRVLVTGGGQGIGLGIARGFAELGAAVVISGRRAEVLERARARFAQEGLEMDCVVGDVSTRSAATAMVEEAVTRLGGLDVLCANAGVYPERDLVDLTEEDVDDQLAVNVKGTIFTVQAAVPALVASERGRVVLTSSITGPITGYPGLSVYGAGKAAQLGFMRSAALELAPSGVSVNAILPGSIRTEGLAGLGDDAIAEMVACIPRGRLGEVSDIAAAAVYLGSRAAGFVTGQTLVVDGGQVLPEHPGAVLSV